MSQTEKKWQDVKNWHRRNEKREGHRCSIKGQQQLSQRIFKNAQLKESFTQFYCLELNKTVLSLIKLND